MKKIVSLAAGLALVASVNTAQAQTCTTDGCTVAHTVSATAPTILRLTLTSTATALANPVEAEFDDVNGVTHGSSFNVERRSNVDASVSIHTTAANWSGPGTTTKAIGDLRYSTTGAAPFTAITGAAVGLIASDRGVDDVDITWNTLWHLATDEPGAYSLATTFTLTTP
ncbi:MAG: hypothetical protein M3N43_02745 [Actinomycetota bacterium]|nr:hypothetical protein [Actinomycetota bacterium]